MTTISDLTPAECPFCLIVRGEAPATVVHRWHNALAVVPLELVIEGHLIVFPTLHVADFAEDPHLTGWVMELASRLARPPANIITSAGREATQTIRHLHLHIVPRAFGDGLALPWTVAS